MENTTENFNELYESEDYNNWLQDEHENKYFPEGKIYEVKNQDFFNFNREIYLKHDFGIINESDEFNTIIFIPASCQKMSNYWVPLYLDLFDKKEEYKEVRLDQM